MKSRRQFLVGAGAVLPLPFLPSLAGCRDEAGLPSAGNGLVVMRAASGVAQLEGELPELWWPRELGPMTADSLGIDNADRATSELADYAERLMLVRGTRFPFRATREQHAGGGNQLLTAAQPGPLSDSVMTYAMGESIDNWIARGSEINGGEPLTLHCGRRDNYGEEVLSYRGPLQLRGAESDPWTVYQRLIGSNGAVGLRVSVNDLVLDQLKAMNRDPNLSREDRTRLELHTDSIRDFEQLSCRLSSRVEQDMEALTGRGHEDAVSLDVARLHCDLIALVLSCDAARAITLQIGDRLDRGRYWVGEERLPQFHELTHGLIANGEMGSFATTHDMHGAINRLHLRVFAHLLDRLDSYGLLDSSVAVFCSDVATGSHRYDNIPWVIAGAGDGTLRQGEYIDAGDVTHDRLLATLLTATGHRNIDGSPMTRFGDESLEGGTIDGMLA